MHLVDSGLPHPEIVPHIGTTVHEGRLVSYLSIALGWDDIVTGSDDLLAVSCVQSAPHPFRVLAAVFPPDLGVGWDLDGWLGNLIVRPCSFQ